MMLIVNGIYQYERRYATLNKNICHFWDHHRARFPEKNSKAWEHIQNDALDFFPYNALGDGPAFWIFFQDSRIRVNIGSKVDFSWAPIAFSRDQWP